MKLAIITDYWKNSPGGGVKTYLVNLADHLKAAGITTDVIFYQGHDPFNYKVAGPRIPGVFKTLVALNRLKPSVINSQNAWYCLLPGCIYKKIFRVKLVHTFHSVPGYRLSRPVLLFTRYLLSQCDTVAFVSKSLKAEYETAYGLKFDNAAIAYAGVEKREVAREDVDRFREKYHVKDDRIVLLAQALTAFKCKAEGAKLLIGSLPALAAKYPRLVLVLTRDGLFLNELKQYAEAAGLQDKVVFTGDLEEPYVPLAICDIFTHISLCDGLPMALLEAMAVGKPVIATGIGGIPELIDHGKDGLLVKPEQGEVVRQIDYLLSHKDAAGKMGATAAAKIKTAFTWQNSVDNYASIYGFTRDG